MSKVTVRQSNQAISKLQPFKSNGNIEGISYADGQLYRVYSYAALLLEVFPEQKIVLLNTARYSVTTSTHQAQVRSGIWKLTQGFQPEWTVLEYGNDQTARHLRNSLKEKQLIAEVF